MTDTPEEITRRTRLLIATDDQRRDALAQIISRIEELREELRDLEAIAAGHRQALEENRAGTLARLAPEFQAGLDRVADNLSADARARSEAFEERTTEMWNAELDAIERGANLP